MYTMPKNQQEMVNDDAAEEFITQKGQGVTHPYHDYTVYSIAPERLLKRICLWRGNETQSKLPARPANSNILKMFVASNPRPST